MKVATLDWQRSTNEAVYIFSTMNYYMLSYAISTLTSRVIVLDINHLVVPNKKLKTILFSTIMFSLLRTHKNS